jgi:hypothetical protein
MFQYRELPEVTTVYSLADLLPGLEDPLARVRDGSSIEQRPGSVLRFALRVPEEARLRGQLRFEGSLDPQPPRNGTLVVRVEDAAKGETLFSQVPTNPMRKLGLAVDSVLAAWAGREIELVIEFRAAEGVPAADRRIVWTDLRVEGREPDLSFDAN